MRVSSKRSLFSDPISIPSVSDDGGSFCRPRKVDTGIANSTGHVSPCVSRGEHSYQVIDKVPQLSLKLQQSAPCVSECSDNRYEATALCSTPEKKTDRCAECKSDVDSPTPGSRLISPSSSSSRRRSKFTRIFGSRLVNSKSRLGQKSRSDVKNETHFRGQARTLKRSTTKGVNSPISRGVRVFLEQFYVKVYL